MYWLITQDNAYNMELSEIQLSFLQSERFYKSDTPEDLVKAESEKGLIDWKPTKLGSNAKYMAGDIATFVTLTKSLRENNPIFEAEFPGKQHLSTKVLLLDKSAFFIKEAKEKASNNEGLAYGLAKLAGLGQFFEPTVSVAIDDKFYSCSNMLPEKFKSITTWKKQNPEALDGVLKRQAELGNSHKLAVFKYVTRDMDNHRGNTYTDGENVKLIDAGRSFNSKGFVYIPGILRDSENNLIKSGNENEIRLWLGGIRADSRLFIFHEYIDRLNFGFRESLCKQISEKWAELASKNPIRGAAQ